MTGILKGVGQIIDRFFDIEHIGTRAPHYGHKGACLKLSGKSPAGLNGFELVEATYKRIEVNWENSSRRRQGRRASRKNWRDEARTDFAGGSPEVQLERAIAMLPGEAWVNQVPTSSGLVDHRHDKVRNIDLLREIEPSRYEFIELKVNSNTPLFAAMEILGYGVIYLFSLLHRDELGYDRPERKVLGAKHIHLKVLAPGRYYTEYQLAWLECLINDGLSAFIESRPELELQMDFRFEAFPPDFHWPPGETGEPELAVALGNRQPVYSRSPLQKN